jgi:hypothetical protein
LILSHRHTVHVGAVGASEVLDPHIQPFAPFLEDMLRHRLLYVLGLLCTIRNATSPKPTTVAVIVVVIIVAPRILVAVVAVKRAGGAQTRVLAREDTLYVSLIRLQALACGRGEVAAAAKHEALTRQEHVLVQVDAQGQAALLTVSVITTADTDVSNSAIVTPTIAAHVRSIASGGTFDHLKPEVPCDQARALGALHSIELDHLCIGQR